MGTERGIIKPENQYGTTPDNWVTIPTCAGCRQRIYKAPGGGSTGSPGIEEDGGIR